MPSCLLSVCWACVCLQGADPWDWNQENAEPKLGFQETYHQSGNRGREQANEVIGSPALTTRKIV